jgi:hypothetical protein
MESFRYDLFSAEKQVNKNKQDERMEKKLNISKIKFK